MLRGKEREENLLNAAILLKMKQEDTNNSIRS